MRSLKLTWKNANYFKIFVFLITTALLLVFYYYISRKDQIEIANSVFINQQSISYFYKNSHSGSDWVKSRAAPCDKWIISTTNSSPTQQLKTLNDAIYGWCLLVVADSSAPQNWTYKDAIFLSLDAQKQLSEKFEFIKHVPLKRKLVGYFYAILHGAKFIFETSDDVMLVEGLYRFRYEHFKGLILKSDEKLLSPDTFYRSTGWYSFSIYHENVPIIQQGCMMDSLQEFDTNVPPLALDTHQYLILDPRNTLFHYNSFWSLFFPLDSDRPNLIRSLLAVRLAKEIDARVALIPSVSLSKNKHQYDQYWDHDLISVIDNWVCGNDLLSECLLSGVGFLVDQSYLNKSELQYYTQWVNALNSIGYKWPKMRKRSKYKPDFKIHFFKPTWSQSGKIFVKFDRLILITFASNPQDLQRILSTWNLYFVYTIICYHGNIEEITSAMNQSRLDSIVIEMKHRNHEKCVSDVFEMGFKHQAFVIAPNEFEFWNYDFGRITFIRTFSQSGFDFGQEDIYFVRKNVADSLRRLKIKKIYSYQSLADYLEHQEASGLFKGFQESINRLNFHDNDLSSEYCEGIKTRTIWIPDYHDGPRVDISSTLTHLGMRAILANPKHHKSPYPEALDLSQVSYSLSNFMRDYVPFERDVYLAKFRENFAYYRNLTEFEQVDAVICSFTVSLCEAFMSLNKTIILNPAHRYNIGRCSQERWKKLNENYFALLNRSKGIISAMSKYDQEYQAHFTGLRGFRLYAYGGFYAKGVQYSPTRKVFLVAPTSYLGSREKLWLGDLNKFARPFGMEFKHVRDVYRRYSLQDLANHPAVVIFPYASMTYSLVDFYIANIPMFVPSIEIFTRAKTVVDRSVNYGPYCGSDNIDIQPDPNTIHDFSPNNDSDLALKYWLKYSDYYQWPFVNVFRSWADLVDQLRFLNLTQISENMRWFNKLRETDLLENWCKIIKNLNKSTIPSSYEDSLRYFNMTDFQV